jgi:hypothetical protein
MLAGIGRTMPRPPPVSAAPMKAARPGVMAVQPLLPKYQSSSKKDKEEFCAKAHTSPPGLAMYSPCLLALKNR